MSKKDKKRIAKLERGMIVLTKRIQNLRVQQVTVRDNFILHLLEEHSQIFEQGSIPQSEPKQGSDGADSQKTYNRIFDKPEQGLPNLAARNEQKQPKTDTPCPRKAALIKMVLGRIKEMENILASPNFGMVDLSFSVDDCANKLKQDLADCRRKLWDFGSMKPSKVDLRNSELGEVEPKETAQTNPENDSEKQGETDQPETEKQQVWIVQTNPKKAERLNFYIDYVGEDGIIRHTPNPDEAMQFYTEMDAQIKIANTISCARGRYKSEDFKIVKKD
jgi:hypothetical protein